MVLTLSPGPHCHLVLTLPPGPHQAPQVPLDRHDIIIDKVAASFDNNHIVAVTSNNMVGSLASSSKRLIL